MTPEETARRAAAQTGLDEHVDDVVADIQRALGALKSEGFARYVGSDLQLEYPIAGAWDGGQLISGYIDLVAATERNVDVIDFKTDAPPEGPVEALYPDYAAQVRTYGRLLEAAGIVDSRKLRCGILFTADGAIRWVEL